MKGFALHITTNMEYLPYLRVSLIACSVVLANLALGLTANAGNVVSNPGFEDGKEKWGLFVPKDGEGMIDGFQISNEAPHSGVSSALMKLTGPGRCALNANLIPVQPGERYRLTAWVKFSGNSVLTQGMPGAFIRATLMESAGKDIADPRRHMHIGLSGKMARVDNVAKLAVSELPKQWTKIEGVIEIPAGTTIMGPALFVQGVTGDVSWDDVSVEAVPANTPLSPEPSL